MVLTITKVVVLKSDGADKIYIHTPFSSPVPKLSSEPLVLSFSAAQNTGVEYVRRVFKTEPEVIESR